MGTFSELLTSISLVVIFSSVGIAMDFSQNVCKEDKYLKPYIVHRAKKHGPVVASKVTPGVIDLRGHTNSFVCINGAVIIYNDVIVKAAKTGKDGGNSSMHHITKVDSSESVRFTNGSFRIFNHTCLPVNWSPKDKSDNETTGFDSPQQNLPVVGMKATGLFLIAPEDPSDSTAIPPPIKVMFNKKYFDYKIGASENIIKDTSFVAVGKGPHCLSLKNDSTIVLKTTAMDEFDICRWSLQKHEKADTIYKQFFRRGLLREDYKWVECPQEFNSNETDDTGKDITKPFATYKHGNVDIAGMDLKHGGSNNTKAPTDSGSEEGPFPDDKNIPKIYVIEVEDCEPLPKYDAGHPECAFLNGSGNCEQFDKLNAALELDSPGTEDPAGSSVPTFTLKGHENLHWKHEVLSLVASLFSKICLPIRRQSAFHLMRLIGNYIVKAHVMESGTSDFSKYVQKSNQWEIIIAHLSRCNQHNKTKAMEWEWSGEIEIEPVSPPQHPQPESSKGNSTTPTPLPPTGNETAASDDTSKDGTKEHVDPLGQKSSGTDDDSKTEPEANPPPLEPEANPPPLEPEANPPPLEPEANPPPLEPEANPPPLEPEANPPPLEPEANPPQLEPQANPPPLEPQANPPPLEPEANPPPLEPEANPPPLEPEANPPPLEDSSNSESADDSKGNNETKREISELPLESVMLTEELVESESEDGDSDDQRETPIIQRSPAEYQEEDITNLTNEFIVGSIPRWRRTDEVEKLPLPFIQEYIPPAPQKSELGQMTHADFMYFPDPSKIRIKGHSEKEIFFYQDYAELAFELNPVIDAFWKVLSTVMGYCRRHEGPRGHGLFSLTYNSFNGYFLDLLEQEWKRPSILKEVEMVSGEFMDEDRKGWLDTCMETAYIVSNSIQLRPSRPLDFDVVDTTTNEGEGGKTKLRANSFVSTPEDEEGASAKYFVKKILPARPRQTSGGGGDRGKGETVKGETGKGETVKGEMGKGETVKGETGKGETGKGETVKGETGKGETGKGETVKGETVKGETVKGETGKGETGKDENKEIIMV